eukprot:scaffold123484_cov28-Tisochrysis_lutea.AAC.1
MSCTANEGGGRVGYWLHGKEAAVRRHVRRSAYLERLGDLPRDWIKRLRAGAERCDLILCQCEASELLSVPTESKVILAIVA